ncbi:response regulator transcription factor [Tenacibaculum sp. M341]|uniref:response regulator transcription factor n=1 Tax=Tenacibaculum sp. M341 TaxID=2530339 RepID=UPI0010448C4A|nr:response regulator transcription factor [Tenacibaculum sp. M341]TCI95094.1 response regulator transcription factor [Tenacibaculum sp. M341]
MKTKENIRIMIADDHTMFIQGIKSMLSKYKHIQVVNEATNGEEAINILKKSAHEIDIAVLDINMPKMSGMEVVKSMKKLGITTKTLILTMHQEGTIIKEIINAGANGYILKNIDKQEFVDALETINEGNDYLKGEVLDNYITANKAPQPKNVHLTKREIEVLQLIANDHTSGEIALKLHIEVSTVNTYRRNLIEKIGTKSSHGLVKFAIDHKYI